LRSSKIEKLKEREHFWVVLTIGLDRSKKFKLSQLRKLFEILKVMILIKYKPLQIQKCFKSKFNIQKIVFRPIST
jgi:hypothetical protein